MNANELVSRMLETQQVTFSFGKNGWGLSDEFIFIGNRIKELSQNYNVYLSEAKIDACDDIYNLTFDLRPHTKSNINPVSKIDETFPDNVGIFNGLNTI